MSDELSGYCERWGVNARTVKNWREKGEEVGEAPPLGAADPGEFLEWYRAHYGREPVKGVREAAERELAERGELAVEPVPVDLRDVDLLRTVLSKLGLSLSLARVLEEEERAYADYERLRDEGKNLDRALKRWGDAVEFKRQLQKSPDAVDAALELLRQWVKGEFEPGEREVRARIGGDRLGREAREALMATTTEAEWVKVWDKLLEGALRVERVGE